VPTKEPPTWIKKLRGSCPKGWSVKESRGKIRLSIRKGAGGKEGTSATLPLAWAADELPAFRQLIAELESQIAEGRTLQDALRPAPGAFARPITTGNSDWEALVDAFRHELMTNRNEIGEQTWKDSYGRPLGYLLELMAKQCPPVDARELTAAVAAKWKGKPRSRELAVNACKGLLEFGIETKVLAPATWTLGDSAAKSLKGKKATKRTVAAPRDFELLELIDGLDHQGWQNALRLMCLYGLRPEELNHLQVRQHPDTGKPALFCSYAKTCGSTKTAPRWLMPLPLTDANGDLVQWNIPQLMAAGLFPLPSLGSKFAVRTFLQRQPGWVALAERYDASGEWLRPYSMRNSFSLRAHRAGHRLDVVCLAMGHSLAVHQKSYEWARDSSVLEHIS